MIAAYSVQNQWGGSSAPWNPAGDWVLGGRSNQNPVSVNAKSNDNGQTLEGQMVYAGEGPIGFLAKRTSGNNYNVQNQWGGSSAPWHDGGTWVIGSRDNQYVVQLDISTKDDAATFTGTMTYSGEGPIGFQAKNLSA
ncbi:MAG TPA: lectin OAA [Thermoanaerobaculia bacterium]